MRRRRHRNEKRTSVNHIIHVFTNYCILGETVGNCRISRIFKGSYYTLRHPDLPIFLGNRKSINFSDKEIEFIDVELNFLNMGV